MSTPLRVLIVTDAFPPVCGGSGWSTWELARGLTARGHRVDVVKIEIGSPAAIVEQQYESTRITVFRRPAPQVPFIRNVVKNEWLWHELAVYLSARVADDDVDIIHAQHVMTTVPSIHAGRRAGVPVVATVRDYWPVCYWSDLIYDPAQPQLCPTCSVSMMTQCVRPRAGRLTVASWSLIPYMRANLRTKRRTLAQASAIVAVSSTIARDLAARAPEIDAPLIHTIPNPIDMVALDRSAAASVTPMPDPYVLYAGKLATNKGVQYLLPAMAAAGLRLPLVIIGDGPLRESLEADAASRGIDVRVLGWRTREEVWAWMRHATMLAFPSYGPESLSRVLIEAAALGAPIAAMDTGGTRDILTHRVTGLLSTDVEGLARDLAELARDERLRAALGQAAQADVHKRFAATAVIEQIEHVYRSLVPPEAA